MCTCKNLFDTLIDRTSAVTETAKRIQILEDENTDLLLKNDHLQQYLDEAMDINTQWKLKCDQYKETAKSLVPKKECVDADVQTMYMG